MNDEESDVVEFKLAPENEQFHIGDYVRLKLWVVRPMHWGDIHPECGTKAKWES